MSVKERGPLLGPRAGDDLFRWISSFASSTRPVSHRRDPRQSVVRSLSLRGSAQYKRAAIGNMKWPLRASTRRCVWHFFRTDPTYSNRFYITWRGDLALQIAWPKFPLARAASSQTLSTRDRNVHSTLAMRVGLNERGRPSFDVMRIALRANIA